MRFRYWLAHWGLSAAPLLLFLLAVAVFLPGQEAVHDFMKQHRGMHLCLQCDMRLIANWGNAIFYLVYARYLYLGIKRKDRALVRLAVCYLVVQLVVAFGVVRLLKIAIGFPRPGIEGLCVPFSLDSSHHSFPSGHSAEISGAAGALALWHGRWPLSLLMGLAIALVGASRVYLGSHHLWDVLAGLALGGLSATLIVLLAKERLHVFSKKR